MTKTFTIVAVLSTAAIAFWLGNAAGGRADAADEKKKAIETADAPKAIGPYSQAIVADDLIFLAGQVGFDPKSGKMVEGGAAEQAEQALKNLDAVLKASGSSFDNVVKTTIFLADMNDFAAVNEVYGKVLKAPYPARSTVQAARLPRDAKIEIEMIALRGRK